MKAVRKQCSICKKVFEIIVTDEQYGELQERERSPRTARHIQHILPRCDERELFISGFCSRCFDKLFEEE